MPIDCGQNHKFVEQMTRSAGNGAHWVRMTFHNPYDLKQSWNATIWWSKPKIAAFFHFWLQNFYSFFSLNCFQ
jgi:hypothetical protein